MRVSHCVVSGADPSQEIVAPDSVETHPSRGLRSSSAQGRLRLLPKPCGGELEVHEPEDVGQGRDDLRRAMVRSNAATARIAAGLRTQPAQLLRWSIELSTVRPAVVGSSYPSVGHDARPLFTAVGSIMITAARRTSGRRSFRATACSAVAPALGGEMIRATANGHAPHPQCQRYRPCREPLRQQFPSRPRLSNLLHLPNAGIKPLRSKLA
jgi:hypothetical protein